MIRFLLGTGRMLQGQMQRTPRSDMQAPLAAHAQACIPRGVVPTYTPSEINDIHNFNYLIHARKL